MKNLPARCCTVLAMAVAGAGLSVAAEPDFPARPVRLIVPVAAGGARDVIGRDLGREFQKLTGQALVVDNRTGAGGLIGGELAAKAAPDGYTLFMASGAEISIAPALYAKMPFDPQTELVPVIHLVDTPMLLFVAAYFPAQTVKDLVTLAKAKPEGIAAATAGNGSVSHLGLELLSQRAGVRFTVVPYRGAALALNDMAGGQVALIVTTVASAKAMMDGGRIRPLAVAAARRTGSLPNVPTFAEAGYAGIEAPVWFGIMTARGTPERVVEKLRRTFADILAQPDIRKRMATLDADIAGGDARELRTLIREDMERWRRVVKTAGIKIE
jgi:tripartite-type tricarboxylate transporter receptor subunit TctC